MTWHCGMELCTLQPLELHRAGPCKAMLMDQVDLGVWQGHLRRSHSAPKLLGRRCALQCMHGITRGLAGVHFQLKASAIALHSTLLMFRRPHIRQPSPSCSLSLVTYPSLAHWSMCWGSVNAQPRFLYAALTCTYDGCCGGKPAGAPVELVVELVVELCHAPVSMHGNADQHCLALQRKCSGCCH